MGGENNVPAGWYQDAHNLGGCRPPVGWDHLEVSFASGMGPPRRQ